MLLIAGASVCAVLGLAVDATAATSAKRRVVREKPVRKAVEPHHSVVVVASRAGGVRNSATDPNTGTDANTPIALAARLQLHTQWLSDHDRLARPASVRCDVCVTTAATAQPGQVSIFKALDLRSITNRLTTLQIRTATLKITSLSPVGLQFRQPF
ncbi:MAG: hypothetical protein EXR77_12355 [Myxococcales bacterium]|nr:hypothetical protein [Myxococcales bacterium]